MKQIYFDNNATTPPHADVIAEMIEVLEHDWGNPSSSHSLGVKSSKIIELARTRIAKLINSEPSEIYFTSGGTESNQWVINSILQSKKYQMLVSGLEHSSVDCFLDNHSATILPEAYDKAIALLEGLQGQENNKRHIFISKILVNNETGIISPLNKLATFCDDNDILIHSDAVQALGKIRINVKELSVNYLSFSAHKIFGPKGIGAVYVKSGSPITSWHHGSQEAKLRGGTENTSAIAGFGLAAKLMTELFVEKTKKETKLRDYFEASLCELIPNTMVNGKETSRVGNTSNVRFPSIDNDALIMFLSQKGIYISSGSACNSSTIAPSYVLSRMGFSHEHAQESVRFSFSYLNTTEEIDHAIQQLLLAQRILI